MKVIFFNKENAEYITHREVSSLENTTITCNGRLRKVWKLTFKDGRVETVKFRDFDLINVYTLN